MQNANNFEVVETKNVPMKPLGAIADGTYPPMNCADEPKQRLVTASGLFGPNQCANKGGFTKSCCSPFSDGNLVLSSSATVAFGDSEHGREIYDGLTDRNTHEMLITGNSNRFNSYETAGDHLRPVYFGWRVEKGGEFMIFNLSLIHI